MKLKKLTREIQDILSAGKRKRKKHQGDLKTLLGKLKIKEKELIKKASEETDKKKVSRMKKEIGMLHAQRKKGLKALKAIDDEFG